MLRLVIIVLTGTALLGGSPAIAQTVPIAPPASVESVTVRAVNQDRLVDFIQAASALSPDGQVSRRARALCPFVSGAPTEVNIYVTSRIRQVAAQIGIEFEKKACQPNLLVLFSREPQAMLQKARDRRKIRFEPANPTRIRRFMTSTQPVRWWNSIVVAPSIGAASTVSDSDGPPEFASAGTRLRQATRSIVQGSLVVVDASQTDGFEIGAIADYVALVSLTDIKPDADLSSHDSILNLFMPTARRGMTGGLTALDIAYLRGVYGARDNSAGMSQTGQISEVMANALQQ